jgi:hypothetical protein
MVEHDPVDPEERRRPISALAAGGTIAMEAATSHGVTPSLGAEALVGALAGHLAPAVLDRIGRGAVPRRRDRPAGVLAGLAAGLPFPALAAPLGD